jgi:TolB-like protein/tetratricopeptide (TPR) repeat protein/tRNA A-37 threonylcarbamoyl transferase component Bud32
MQTAPRACPACQTPLPEEAHFCLNCGTATPTDPGVPPRTGTTAVDEVTRIREALAGQYQVERVLGEGGMATVYLAEDTKHRRKVAVKVMRPELAATLGAERFLREVEIAAQLSHPHILPVHDSGSAGGLLYYVMPFVEGESLQDRIKRESELPIEDAIRIAREVAEALAYAHAKHIVHRDIKPANIMISAGHALVADFGIARAAGAEGAAITKTGLAVGTPQYMSPEQASGSPNVDARADIFALGCVLYEMVSGEPPFTGPTPQAIVMRSMTETPRPLAATREGLSPALDAVVGRALAKSPADRWQTAQQFADALGRVLDAFRSGERIAAVAPSTGPSPAQVWGLFAFASVMTLGVFYGLVSRWGLPVWLLYLAIALLVIGAGVLVVTGRLEAGRRAGTDTAGFARLFTWRNATLGGVLALGTWAVVVTALVMKGPGGAEAGGAIRLAVLPFDNRGAPEDAYIVDGITDQVRGKLMGLGGFQITARTSSDQYRDSKESPQQIGRELGVDYLLTSTVTLVRTPDGAAHLQVVPELVNVRTGAGAWQQSFDADLTDVFQVQGTIATQVAGALGVVLGTREQEQLAERPTANLPAYELYLKAKALTSNDPATLSQAAGIYEQAVALDSTFAEAWALLSSTLSNLYFNGTPDPAIGARARAAAERAQALEPDGSIVHYALSRYQYLVANDIASAATEATLALRLAPNDVTVLRLAATLEGALGRWDDALAHLQQAHQLDPRSIQVGTALQGTLTVMHRYPEALELGNQLLAMAPGELQLIESQAITHLMQGDLAGARSVIRGAPATLAQTALVAYFANYQDLYWVLDEDQQQLVLRLTPSAFFGDRAVWADVMMQTWWLRGDKARARAYADTSLTELGEQLKQAPNDPQRHLFSGLALAYLGRKDEAIREGTKGAELAPLTRDQTNGAYGQHQLIRIYLLVGEPEKALDLLEPLLKVPYTLSPNWLRIDPTFASLKGNPRFERILKGG